MKLFKGRKRITEDEQREVMERAKALLAGTGLQRGDILICRAVTQLGTLYQWMVCQELGLVPFFIAPDYAIEHSEFLTYTDATYMLSADREEQFSLEMPGAGKGPHYELEPGGEIHMTSATTGKPKYIYRPKAMVDLETERYSGRLGMGPEDVFLSIAPFFHAYSFQSSMLPAIHADATLVIPDALFPRNVIELCRDHGVTILFGVPYFLDKMSDTDPQYGFGSSIRYIISSGEKLTEEVAKRFYNRFGIRLRQQYGSTETGTVTFSEPEEPFESQGKVIPGSEVRIEHRGGKDYMLVNTHGTMGFYIREKLFPIADGWYQTNDLAHFDESGCLYIDGRGDDVVIRAGEKINLREIALVIEKYPGITGAEVTIGNDALQELTCRYNFAPDAGPEPDPSAIITFCREYLSDFQIPRHYVRVQEQTGMAENWKHHK